MILYFGLERPSWLPSHPDFACLLGGRTVLFFFLGREDRKRPYAHVNFLHWYISHKRDPETISMPPPLAIFRFIDQLNYSRLASMYRSENLDSWIASGTYPAVCKSKRPKFAVPAAQARHFLTDIP